MGWDAMTMPFRVDDPALLEGLAPGDEIVADIRFQGQDYSVIDLEKR
ncbi:MAG: copper-binding protein [Deltaproteobacteria bacterium]|nr:copper-binding protein [Deltaproteobacteria bacterium]